MCSITKIEKYVECETEIAVNCWSSNVVTVRAWQERNKIKGRRLQDRSAFAVSKFLNDFEENITS